MSNYPAGVTAFDIPGWDERNEKYGFFCEICGEDCHEDDLVEVKDKMCCPNCAKKLESEDEA